MGTTKHISCSGPTCIATNPANPFERLEEFKITKILVEKIRRLDTLKDKEHDKGVVRGLEKVWIGSCYGIGMVEKLCPDWETYGINRTNPGIPRGVDKHGVSLDLGRGTQGVH